VPQLYRLLNNESLLSEEHFSDLCINGFCNSLICFRFGESSKASGARNSSGPRLFFRLKRIRSIDTAPLSPGGAGAQCRRTVELQLALELTVLLHAARGAGSDRRGPINNLGLSAA